MSHIELNRKMSLLLLLILLLSGIINLVGIAFYFLTIEGYQKYRDIEALEIGERVFLSKLRDFNYVMWKDSMQAAEYLKMPDARFWKDGNLIVIGYDSLEKREMLFQTDNVDTQSSHVQMED